MNKYRNVRTIINGIEFDSCREGERYRELLLLQKAGEICDIELQPKYELQPGYSRRGLKVRPIYYVADFAYYDLIKRCKVVEDVKGMRNQVYLLKRKLFEYRYPELNFVEVA